MNFAALTQVIQSKMEEERATNGHGKRLVKNGVNGGAKREFRLVPQSRIIGEVVQSQRRPLL